MSAASYHYFRTGDDAILGYVDEGTGPAIVLVHGFVCSVKFFENNIGALSQNHRVIALDLRGHGNSSKSLHGHTIARYAQDIKELLDHLNVQNACLVGWSMSGQVVLKYHMLFGAHRIASLGLWDCPLGAVYPEEWNAHGLKGYDMDHFNGFLKMSYTNYEGYCGAFSKKIWAGIDDGCIDWSTQEFLKTPPWIAFAIYSDLVFQNGYDMLPRVTVPVLFMGADSAVTANGKALAVKWYPEQLKEGLYRESHTFESGGHVFFHVEAEKTNQLLCSFVSRTQG